MAKLLLLSILIATLAIPIRASRDRSFHRGLRKTVRWYLIFVCAWVFGCLFIFPRIA